MPFYSVSIMRRDGETERYSANADTPAAAARAALEKYAKEVERQIKAGDDDPRWRRRWEANRIPRFVEVFGTDGRRIASVDANGDPV